MIKRIYDFLFYSCRHKWKIIKEVNLVIEEDDLPHGQKITLQCEKCGNIKSKRI